VLQYLVKSKARRRLLTLLWGNGAVSGTVAQLAAHAHVAFGSAYHELHEMKLLGLVTSAREDGGEVFRANKGSPYARLLRDLVAAPATPAPSQAEASAMRARLRALGAPFLEPAAKVTDIEQTLVEAVTFAHRDPAVARVLPLCFRNAADRLEADRLLDLARKAGEKAAVGFFVDLTATLSHDARFRRWASMFRDQRYRARRSFFPDPSAVSRRVADKNTLPLARRWGFRMNMGLDVFRSALTKLRRSRRATSRLPAATSALLTRRDRRVKRGRRQLAQ
jgi:hypothetical protein